MFDENALITAYPTNTTGDIGNIVNADSYRVFANNSKYLVNSGGYDQLGQGNPQPDMDLLPKDQLAKAVSSYSFLANKFDSSFAGGLYSLTSKTLNTGNLAALPYVTPGLWQNGMKVEFTATNTNIGSDTIQINSGTVYPIVKPVLNYNTNTIIYVPLISKDILQNQDVILKYSATASTGNPAFILETKNTEMWGMHWTVQNQFNVTYNGSSFNYPVAFDFFSPDVINGGYTPNEIVSSTNFSTLIIPEDGLYYIENNVKGFYTTNYPFIVNSVLSESNITVMEVTNTVWTTLYNTRYWFFNNCSTILKLKAGFQIRPYVRNINTNFTVNGLNNPIAGADATTLSAPQVACTFQIQKIGI